MFNKDGKQNSKEVKQRKSALINEINKQIKRIECYENTELFEIHKLFYNENLEHI